MLVITGTGRSGTSAIGRWLDNCGALPYESEWIPQFNSGYEPKDVSRLNSAIWLGNDATLQSLPIQEEMIKGFNYEIVKDPMFFYGNVLDTWLSVRNDLTFLICLRNFHHVEKSRRKANQLNQIKTPEELRLCFGTFLSTLIFKGIDYRIINYPNFIEEHDRVFDMINELDPCALRNRKTNKEISRKKSKKIWEESMDKNLIHL
jgi:hypothetical protein